MSENIEVPEQQRSSGPENHRVSGRWTGRRRWIVAGLGLILLGLVVLGGIKLRRIYNLALLLKEDLAQIQELANGSGSRIERIRQAGPALSDLQQDFRVLKDEVEPFLGFGEWLRWVPVYGGDLAAARDLVVLADSLLGSLDTTYQALLPLVEQGGLSTIDPYRLTNFLKDAQPELKRSQAELEIAVSARDRLEIEGLSPQLRELIMERVDPALALYQDGLVLAAEFPNLMGAAGAGSQKYLLLVQNEDELRPTGGFITAADTLVVRNGRLGEVVFVNSGDLDNWSRPYPVAPWQLRQYMNSSVLIFRDANWFTHYPTAATYAEYLYSFSEDRAVNGVIAFDQRVLVELLKVTGPIQVEEVAYLIDADNVVAYMRAAKEPTPENLATPGWTNKAFLNKLTIALIRKVFSGAVQWEPLATVLLQVLHERHLLVQVDNASVASLLERNYWDGAVRPGEGDFLMVVDSNIGFNKASAMIKTSLTYEVDLSNPISPQSRLTVDHENQAEGVAVCKHWSKIKSEGEQYYPVSDCYWNYLRVYTPQGTKVVDASPQDIPDNWMIIMRETPSQVDVLDEEIDGVQAFGTLQVVPGGQVLSVDFKFALPPRVLKNRNASNMKVYHLRVQKQPGTGAVPLILRVQLPKNSDIVEFPSGAVVKGSTLLYTAKLATDLELEVVFAMPSRP